MNRSHAIALVYIAVIACAFVYFGLLQHFGWSGLEFHVEGRDRSFTMLDIMIVIATIAASLLLIISFLAYKRTHDTRILVVSMAFFFFALKEVLFVFENFFPNENIYIDNAERVLELLILISFIMLMYGTYKRDKKARR